VLHTENARISGRGSIRFRILGPIEAWADEHRLSLGGPRQRTLLAYLLLNPNRGCRATGSPMPYGGRVDQRVTAVWPWRWLDCEKRLSH